MSSWHRVLIMVLGNVCSSPNSFWFRFDPAMAPGSQELAADNFATATMLWRSCKRSVPTLRGKPVQFIRRERFALLGTFAALEHAASVHCVGVLVGIVFVFRVL